MASQYTQMEWVGSSSSPSNSYIDLNYRIDDKTRIITKIAINGYTSTNGVIFGTDNKDNSEAFGLMSYNAYGRIYYDYGSSTNRLYFDGLYPSTTPVEVELGNRYVNLNGQQVISNSAVSFIPLQHTLYILGSKTNRSYNCQNRIYEFKIYEEDTLVMELLPAKKKGTDIYGFYDTKSKMFFENDTGIALSHGNELEDIPSDDGIYTDLLGLQIEFKKSGAISTYIKSFDVNSKKIDYSHTALRDQNQRLTNVLSSVNQQFAIDDAQKSGIYSSLEQKVTIEPGKDVVSNNLITKLTKDYSAEDLDAKMATISDYNLLVAATCANVMANYYTKAEVDALVDKGSGGKMDGYHTKTEIDILIPEKEDLTKVQTFLDDQIEYISNLAIFTELNGETN